MFNPLLKTYIKTKINEKRKRNKYLQGRKLFSSAFLTHLKNERLM
ncbi:MAG: hypothetical protein GBAus27B_000488 [Mycoplasmataceae bacterium]|nr:MAG: hypothetical protein GBAus27B_000488 [Mycoplasmataceae bacterium]